MRSSSFRSLSIAALIVATVILLLSPAYARDETPTPTSPPTPTSVPSPLPSAVGPEELPPVDLPAAPVVEPQVLAARFRQPATVRARSEPAPLPFTGPTEALLVWTAVGLGLSGAGISLARRRHNAS